ncbi:glutamate-gated chloride channel subunit beta-like [Penaeus monodon]|uniref:glutamate-gated chloride channel subunit beta-like n=1 Tax=Penaeus monodon TaxID=6687 RepID=UPI0018A782FE|nr:glutamate-gated chloride channel subunit beta-like [Penaeus monodon]
MATFYVFKLNLWKVKQTAGVESHYSTMRVDVQFTRRSGHYVITHHLPIAFVLILAYGTLFLKLPTFLDRIIVSLSSFLLAVSIFSQVCSGLPKTAYFKMVDIWLFVCLVLIFAIVVCHATIEYVSEEGDLSSGRSSTASGRITRVQPDPTRPLSHKNGILAPTDPVPVETYPQERREEYQDPGVPKPMVWPPHVMALMAGRICIPVTFVIFNLAYWSSAMQWGFTPPFFRDETTMHIRGYQIQKLNPYGENVRLRKLEKLKSALYMQYQGIKPSLDILVALPTQI